MKFDLRTSILAQTKMEVNIMFKLHICMLGIHLLFSKLMFRKQSFRHPIRVSNGLDQDQGAQDLVLDLFFV